MKNIHEKVSHKMLFIVVSFLVPLLLVGGYFAWTRFSSLQKEKAELLVTKSTLEETLKITEENVQTLLGEKETLALDLERAEKKIKQVTKTVDKLEKLTETDPELLRKYSKVYFLNENYVPEELADIKSDYVLPKDRQIQFHAKVYEHLEDLLLEARKEQIPLYVLSAYRSFDTQKTVKSTYASTFGAGSANAFIADQGYSEHQLGTTVDFTIPGTVGAGSEFEKTTAYAWLLEHAHEYGFVLSYPKNNSYYLFEPWHWRYVGVSLAKKLFREKKVFYDEDQRTIDNYIVKFFD